MRKEWKDLDNTYRLFDLITPKFEEVKVAFYFVISDTIYCEDSKLAMKYAFEDDRRRSRVITKKGYRGFMTI